MQTIISRVSFVLFLLMVIIHLLAYGGKSLLEEYEVLYYVGFSPIIPVMFSLITEERKAKEPLLRNNHLHKILAVYVVMNTLFILPEIEQHLILLNGNYVKTSRGEESYVSASTLQAQSATIVYFKDEPARYDSNSGAMILISKREYERETALQSRWLSGVCMYSSFLAAAYFRNPQEKEKHQRKRKAKTLLLFDDDY